MKILFACTFKGLLASDDNTNYYLSHTSLIFFQQDIKHVGVYRSSANLSTKNFSIENNIK